MALFSPVTGFSTTLAQSMTSSQLTMVLSSVTVQGHALVAADYGSVLYFTINPGAANMEVVKCTTNSGTTFTIDAAGRGLAWYGEAETQPTGYAFDHNAGEPVIISNTKEVYNQIVDKFTDETVGGVKTFSSYPKIATYAAPTANEQFAPKKYADDLAIAGSPDASTTVKGIVEEATQAEVLARTAAGATSARLFINPSTLPATLYSDYAADSVGTDSYAIAPTPAITAYVAGQVFVWKAGTANTGAATLAVSGLASKALQKNGVALVTGDINANDIVISVYDGAAFQVIGCAPTVEGLKGVNAATTVANLNEAMTFFNSTDITAAEAESLTGGITTPIGTLHAHKSIGISASRDMTATSGAVTYAHGLGAIPNWVRVTAGMKKADGATAGTSFGRYDRPAGTTATMYMSVASGGAVPTFGADTTNVVYLDQQGGNSQLAVCTVDATNVTLTWTKAGTPTSTAYLVIETGV